MMPLISLCHTTARLNHGWLEACNRWRLNCKDEFRIEYILVTDPLEGHEAVRGEFAALYHRWPLTQMIDNAGAHSCVSGWNKAAEKARGQVLIEVADDYWPEVPNWDEAILNAFGDLNREAVLDVDNQDNSGGLMAFCFVTRPYYERYGYLEHPSFESIHGDTEFTERAQKDGVVIDARHLKFHHTNPGSDPSNWDAVYKQQRRREALSLGDQMLGKRRAENFA